MPNTDSSHTSIKLSRQKIFDTQIKSLFQKTKLLHNVKDFNSTPLNKIIDNFQKISATYFNLNHQNAYVKPVFKEFLIIFALISFCVFGDDVLDQEWEYEGKVRDLVRDQKILEMGVCEVFMRDLRNYREELRK